MRHFPTQQPNKAWEQQTGAPCPQQSLKEDRYEITPHLSKPQPFTQAAEHLFKPCHGAEPAPGMDAARHGRRRRSDLRPQNAGGVHSQRLLRQKREAVQRHQGRRRLCRLQRYRLIQAPEQRPAGKVQRPRHGKRAGLGLQPDFDPGAQGTGAGVRKPSAQHLRHLL